MEFSALQQIAELVSGTVEGDAQRKSAHSQKSKAGPHDLAFWPSQIRPSYYTLHEAGVILIGNDFKPEQPVNATLIH